MLKSKKIWNVLFSLFLLSCTSEKDPITLNSSAPSSPQDFAVQGSDVSAESTIGSIYLEFSNTRKSRKDTDKLLKDAIGKFLNDINLNSNEFVSKESSLVELSKLNEMILNYSIIFDELPTSIDRYLEVLLESCQNIRAFDCKNIKFLGSVSNTFLVILEILKLKNMSVGEYYHLIEIAYAIKNETKGIGSNIVSNRLSKLLLNRYEEIVLRSYKLIKNEAGEQDIIVRTPTNKNNVEQLSLVSNRLGVELYLHSNDQEMLDYTKEFINTHNDLFVANNVNYVLSEDLYNVFRKMNSELGANQSIENFLNEYVSTPTKYTNFKKSLNDLFEYSNSNYLVDKDLLEKFNNEISLSKQEKEAFYLVNSKVESGVIEGSISEIIRENVDFSTLLSVSKFYISTELLSLVFNSHKVAGDLFKDFTSRNSEGSVRILDELPEDIKQSLIGDWANFESRVTAIEDLLHGFYRERRKTLSAVEQELYNQYFIQSEDIGQMMNMLFVYPVQTVMLNYVVTGIETIPTKYFSFFFSSIELTTDESNLISQLLDGDFFPAIELSPRQYSTKKINPMQNQFFLNYMLKFNFLDFYQVDSKEVMKSFFDAYFKYDKDLIKLWRDKTQKVFSFDQNNSPGKTCASISKFQNGAKLEDIPAFDINFKLDNLTTRTFMGKDYHHHSDEKLASLMKFLVSGRTDYNENDTGYHNSVGYLIDILTHDMLPKFRMFDLMASYTCDSESNDDCLHPNILQYKNEILNEFTSELIDYVEDGIECIYSALDAEKKRKVSIFKMEKKYHEVIYLLTGLLNQLGSKSKKVLVSELATIDISDEVRDFLNMELFKKLNPQLPLYDSVIELVYNEFYSIGEDGYATKSGAKVSGIQDFKSVFITTPPIRYTGNNFDYIINVDYFKIRTAGFLINGYEDMTRYMPIDDIYFDFPEEASSLSFSSSKSNFTNIKRVPHYFLKNFDLNGDDFKLASHEFTMDFQKNLGGTSISYGLSAVNWFHINNQEVDVVGHLLGLKTGVFKLKTYLAAEKNKELCDYEINCNVLENTDLHAINAENFNDITKYISKSLDYFNNDEDLLNVLNTLESDSSFQILWGYSSGPLKLFYFNRVDLQLEDLLSFFDFYFISLTGKRNHLFSNFWGVFDIVENFFYPTASTEMGPVIGNHSFVIGSVIGGKVFGGRGGAVKIDPKMQIDSHRKNAFNRSELIFNTLDKINKNELWMMPEPKDLSKITWLFREPMTRYFLPIDDFLKRLDDFKSDVYSGKVEFNDYYNFDARQEPLLLKDKSNDLIFTNDFKVDFQGRVREYFDDFNVLVPDYMRDNAEEYEGVWYNEFQ